MATLPIKRGYYRASNRSTNVVRCSDSGVGCGSSNECANSTSGCRGGPDFARTCAPSLRGIFCELCDSSIFGNGANTNSSAFDAGVTKSYYVAASPLAPAHCEECGATGFVSVIAICGVLIGLVAIFTCATRAMPKLTSPATRDRIDKFF